MKMSYTRFEIIIQFLHTSQEFDNDPKSNKDRLYLIRNLLEMINFQLKTNSEVADFLTID